MPEFSEACKLGNICCYNRIYLALHKVVLNAALSAARAHAPNYPCRRPAHAQIINSCGRTGQHDSLPLRQLSRSYRRSLLHPLPFLRTVSVLSTYHLSPLLLLDMFRSPLPLSLLSPHTSIYHRNEVPWSKCVKSAVGYVATQLVKVCWIGQHMCKDIKLGTGHIKYFTDFGGSPGDVDIVLFCCRCYCWPQPSL